MGETLLQTKYASYMGDDMVIYRSFFRIVFIDQVNWKFGYILPVVSPAASSKVRGDSEKLVSSCVRFLGIELLQDAIHFRFQAVHTALQPVHPCTEGSHVLNQAVNPCAHLYNALTQWKKRCL